MARHLKKGPHRRGVSAIEAGLDDGVTIPPMRFWEWKQVLKFEDNGTFTREQIERLWGKIPKKILAQIARMKKLEKSKIE